MSTMECFRITTNDRKYTYVMREDGRTYALRYGEQWIENLNVIPGSLMLLAFASDLEAARQEIAELNALLEEEVAA